MSRISYSIWFDDRAEEAAEFYTSVFPGAKLLSTTPYYIETPSDKPLGSTMLATIEIEGRRFELINGGSGFTPNPSISFFVNRDTREEIDELWGKLTDGGMALMPLQEYPFSRHYGWVQDKYGVSWQLMMPNADSDRRSSLVPSLMFTGKNYGQAEAAVAFYLSVFEDSERGSLARYGEAASDEDEPDKVMYADFRLLEQWFAAMESGYDHKFQFSEGISLVVNCETQAEVDRYWEKLSAVPEAEQCGWLKDRFGVSWQIIPQRLNELMESVDPEEARRGMEAMLQMKKIDIEALEEAVR